MVRTLQQYTVNEKFGKFSNAIFIAEDQVRKEINTRNKIRKNLVQKEFLKQEDLMRKAAIRAREEKVKLSEKSFNSVELKEQTKRNPTKRSRGRKTGEGYDQEY